MKHASTVRVLLASTAWLIAVASGAPRAAGPPIVRLEAAQAGAATPATQASPQRALLNQYCVGCHNPRTNAGGLSLDQQVDLGRVGDHAELFERVVAKMRGGMMPPVGRPRPDQQAYDGFVTWLEGQLDTAAAKNPNAGRTESLHRLNRAEYRNAVRDLLAVDAEVTELLPADDSSYGFDNIAGVLKVNQSLLERYLTAAHKISRAAVGAPLQKPTSATYAVSPLFSQEQRVEGLPFGTRGGTLIKHPFPQSGEYEIKIELLCPNENDTKCDAAGGFPEEHHLEVSIDGERVKLFTIEPRPQENGWNSEWDQRFKVRVPVQGGPRDLAVTFLRLANSEVVTDGYRKRFQRQFRYYADASPQTAPWVDKVIISGPFSQTGPGDTPSRQRIFKCHPTKAQEEDGCAKTIFSALARRAYRRPVTAKEVESLLVSYRRGRTDGGSFEAGVEAGLRRLLVSPNFLLRVERDPGGLASSGQGQAPVASVVRGAAPPAGPTNYRISDLELASRLSFFLWSSIPDEELLGVATDGKLKDPQVLEKQVRRMLGDPRADALVTNFAGQWLELRNLQAVQPSEYVLPDFDDRLRGDLRRETELFFESIIREDRSVIDLLTADYTFLNERLARHYGIPNVRGTTFRRVTYPDDRRRGLLGQGSILTVTSHAVRTSPVFRGKWVMTNILGTPPPAPPANVPPLPEKKDGDAPKTMRERMAAHRGNPVCASCHAVIDPLGFALENFDPIGRWRDVDDGFNPIDSSGTLPDATKFSDLASFRKALLGRPDRFARTMIEKLMVYSLGRGLEFYDMPAARAVSKNAAAGNFRFSAVVLGIVNSPPFQMRRSRS